MADYAMVQTMGLWKKNKKKVDQSSVAYEWNLESQDTRESEKYKVKKYWSAFMISKEWAIINQFWQNWKKHYTFNF